MNWYKVLSLYMVLTLLASCGEEEIAMPDNGGKTMPVSFKLKGNANRDSKTGDTGDEWAEGSCENIDKVRIMVFKEETANPGVFIYRSPDAYITDKQGNPTTDGVVNCEWDGGRGIGEAQANFKPDENGRYRIYAIGYDESQFKNVTLHLDGRQLFYNTRYHALFGDDGLLLSDVKNDIGDNFDATKYASLSVSAQKDGKYAPLEFFAGTVTTVNWTENVGDDGIVESGDLDTNKALTGVLYRATGRFSFQLTDIPEEYAKVRLVMEKYSDKSLIGCGYLWAAEHYPYLNDMYGMFFSNEQAMVVVDEQPVTAGSVHLKVDAIGAQDFKLYVEPVGSDGMGKGKFLIRCKDVAYYPGYVTIVDHVVSDGLFTLNANYWGVLNGQFNRFNNVKIDLTPWSEWKRFPTEGVLGI